MAKKNKTNSKKKNNSLTKFFILFGILMITINVIGLAFFRAEFFDIFGILVWIFFLGLGAWMLLTHAETPDWAAWIVFIIGVLGLITDGYIVIKTFIIGG